MRVRNSVLAAGACIALLLSSSCSPNSDNKQIRTYQLGERIQLGQFIYSVFETQWLTQLGEGPSARIPQHRFFLVRVSITNAGSADAITPPLHLVDDKGETYTELANGEGVPNWAGSLRHIKPANNSQGNIIFDANPGHYKLRITDESEQKVALVDIPLSFASETPPVTVPQTPDSDKKGLVRSPGAR